MTDLTDEQVEAGLAQMTEAFNARGNRLLACEAERERMRVALAPFDRIAEALDDPSWSDTDELHLFSEDGYLLAKPLFGDFRRARATLTKDQQDVAEVPAIEWDDRVNEGYRAHDD
jgi:hypothetical protein